MGSNGEVEGPHRSARSEPRAHTVFQRPRRHYRASRPPPTIVRRQLPPLRSRPNPRAKKYADPPRMTKSGTASVAAPPGVSLTRRMATTTHTRLAQKPIAAFPRSIRLIFSAGVTTNHSATLTSNGEVEGPDQSARLEPRAHTVFQRPRRHYRRSRTPPTIVRRHGGEL